MQGTPDYIAPEVLSYEPVHFKTGKDLLYQVEW